ncbi:MAG: radical SAM protein [Smithella sp.]|jgi:DNA repair photolyase
MNDKPAFGTKEWASKNENLIKGCSNDCKYCYAKAMTIQHKKNTQEEWKNEIVNQGKLRKGFRKYDGRIMFPSSHDITPEHLYDCMTFLSHILKSGNNVLVVSKPHLICIKPICDYLKEYKDNILFRFTIGSADSNVLKFWEPNAPDFDERLKSLKYAYSAGYQTSVSCEPMLDDKIDQVIVKVLPYVTETIWIGKPNKLNERLSINGFKNDQVTMEAARGLMQLFSDEYILELYDRYRNNPKIMWKDSIKKVVERADNARQRLGQDTQPVC